jgi:ribonuclease P protein component
MQGGLRDAPDSPSEASVAARSFAFPASRRLRGAVAFERAFRSGKRATGKYFVVYRLDSEGAPGGLGMVISKRTAGGGVHRNRIKRLVREVYRVSSGSVRAIDFVVRLKARPGVDMLSEARHELSRLLEGGP